MRSIMILAYAISPTRGSEYAVGWNFVINLAKRNKVYVLCGLSGDHMGDTTEIEEFFQKNPNPNVRLIPIKPPPIADLINWPNKVGLLGPIFYLAFPFWQKKAYRVAKKIVATERIDIIHHLNPIGFREPGYLWELDKPFIWGPIGGALFVKFELLKNIPLRHQIFFLIKNAINFLQLKFSRRIRRAVRKASVVVFCNTENKRNFMKFIGRTGQIISEQGTFQCISVNRIARHNIASQGLHFVWVGNISPRKNLYFLFNALALVQPRAKWRLSIVGGGGESEISGLKKLAHELSISSNIVWHGKKTRDESIQLMAEADMHVMTSLGEGNPAVLYEAISLGVPTISLDQDGMHDTLTGGNGILIPVSDYESTLKLYASKLEEVLLSPEMLAELQKRNILMAEEFSWENKIRQFEEIYKSAITDLR